MTRPVTVSIPHKLGRDEARRRIELGFGQLKQQITGGLGGVLKLEERWEGDQLHFAGGSWGQAVSGRIDVQDDAVQIELDLPEFLASLAERVAGRLKRVGQQLLERK